MPIAYVLLAVLGGAVMPIQAGFNRELGGKLGSPLFATLNNFLGGTLLMLAVCAAAMMRGGALAVPTGAAVAAAPWWSWLGGACGVTLVFSATVAVSKIGSVGVVAALLTGQLICSLVIDHWGLIGHAVREVTPTRLAGVGLVVGGMVLIQRW